jgi:hypothetical protein
MADKTNDRRKLSFAQAEGAEALPNQLKPREISKDLRLALWDFWHALISNSLGDFPARVVGDMRAALRKKHIYFDKQPADEFDDRINWVSSSFKQTIMSGTYVQAFGLTQFMIREIDETELSNCVDDILVRYSSAYRVVDNTLMPIGSPEEVAVIQKAVADLADASLSGARQHLRSAAEKLSDRQFADSIRESIHAVESVARTLEPSAELSKALSKLEKTAGIHGGLKKGFLAIYGYTSDEKGIRHPLLDDPSAKVDEPDALFMIGA